MLSESAKEESCSDVNIGGRLQASTTRSKLSCRSRTAPSMLWSGASTLALVRVLTRRLGWHAEEHPVFRVLNPLTRELWVLSGVEHKSSPRLRASRPGRRLRPKPRRGPGQLSRTLARASLNSSTRGPDGRNIRLLRPIPVCLSCAGAQHLPVGFSGWSNRSKDFKP